MAQFQAGFNTRIRVNASAYVAQTYSLSDENPEQDVTNTEGIPGNPDLPENVGEAAASYIGGINRMRGTVTNATFDLLGNPFTAPESIQASAYISLAIHPNLAANIPWSSPSFYINNASMNGDVRTLQPVSFSGVGDGFYSLPGDVPEGESEG